MPIWKLIQEAENCGWQIDRRRSSPTHHVLVRPDKPYPLTIDGALNDIIAPSIAAAILALACDD